MAKIEEQNTSGLSGLKKAAKIAAGTLLMTVFPKRRHRMERLATIPWHDDEQPDTADRLIRAALLRRKSLDNSGEKLAYLHKNFWSEQSAGAYYAGTKTRFERVFLPHLDHFLDQLAVELKSTTFTRLLRLVVEAVSLGTTTGNKVDYRIRSQR